MLASLSIPHNYIDILPQHIHDIQKRKSEKSFAIWFENYRNLSIIDCLSFVMCLLLVLLVKGFFSIFLLWPFTVLMKQTSQVICAVKQSIFLRCLCWKHRRCLTCGLSPRKSYWMGRLSTIGLLVLTKLYWLLFIENIIQLFYKAS
jgi:hypothetical protein